MEVKVLEEAKRKIVFELKGADHTLCNSLKKELVKDSSVVNATYGVDHPQIGTPVLIVETNTKKTPSKAMKDAAKNLQKRNSDFLKAFKKLK